MKKYLFLGCIFLTAAVAVLDFDFNLPVSLLLFTLIFAIRLTFRRHLSEFVALVLSFRDVLFIGILKELFDGAFGTGIPEFGDLTADTIGIAIPFVGLVLVEFFGVGYESLVHDGRHSNLQKIVANEENYFARQFKFLRHAGLKLFYQL